MMPQRLMRSGGRGIPTRSLDFEASSSQSLIISDANFGAYDRGKIGISVWLKRESTGNSVILSHGVNPNAAFSLSLNLDRIDFSNSDDGFTPRGAFQSNTQLNNTSVWYHVYFKYDNTAGAGDRLRCWINGSEDTGLSETDTSVTMFNSSSNICWGQINSTSYYDGLMYQPAFFSGTLPTIGQLYNSGLPMDVRGLPGLWSLLQTTVSSDLTDDYIISAANWTNSNGVIVSTSTP